MSVTTTIYGLCSQVVPNSPMSYELRFDAASQSKFYRITGTPSTSGGLITELSIHIVDANTPGYEPCSHPIALGSNSKRPNNSNFNNNPTSNCYTMPAGLTEVLSLTITNGGTHEETDPYNDSDRG